MIQFYAPDIETTLTLPESDSQHCVRVLRKTEDDIIEVIDGCGHRFSCRITDAHPKRTRVEIISREELPSFWKGRIIIGVAPTKHLDRMEWMAEKLTEIGVDTLVPLLCRYSERKELKTERLEKIVVSAMKQSLKGVCPKVEPMMKFKEFISLTASVPQRFIAHCDPDKPRRLLSREYRPGQDAVIIIGPEGDFSPEEIDLATASGFIPVSLGDARLRTETAAIVACDTCHIVSQLAD